MPNALSIAKAISRKSRLSIFRSSIAWLSGVIVSRGISQVSAMISATLSNVVDIGALNWALQAGAGPKSSGARVGEDCRWVEFGCPYSEGKPLIQRLERASYREVAKSLYYRAIDPNQPSGS